MKPEKLKSKIEALDQIDVDHMSEHFHRIRTAKGGGLDSPKFTAVVRLDGDGGPDEPTVLRHESGSHFRPEGDDVILLFCARGQPFQERSDYRRRLKEVKRRRARHLAQSKAKAERRQKDRPVPE